MFGLGPMLAMQCSSSIVRRLRLSIVRRSARGAPEASARLQLSPKGKRNRAEQKEERDSMIPFEALTEIRPRENDEHTESDYLLDDFQLKCRELAVTYAIRGDLKTVFGKRDRPAHQDYRDKRSLAVFQVTIPGDGHEDVRANKK
jgi:hypothetical protein